MTQRLSRSLIDEVLERAATTHHVVVEPGGMVAIAPVVADLFPGRPVVIVADEITHGIAGVRIRTVLESAGHPMHEPVILPGAPVLRPDTRHVTAIRNRLSEAGAPVVPLAVGSGSINDLTKRAAHELKLPYISVPTAASMDGYTASGAALIHNGVKQTFDCAAPVAVIADLDLLCAAPASMTAAGYGDLLGKVTAGADWIVADALGIEPIDPTVWDLVQGPLPGLIANPGRYRSGDPGSIEQLFLGLTVSGLAIQISGSTRCASGSEHQFSHLWEMRGLEQGGEAVSHGFKVGFGAIFSTVLYERLRARDWSTFDLDAAVAKWPSLEELETGILAMNDSPALIERALAESRAKHIEPPALHERLRTFRHQWPALKSQLADQLLPVLALGAYLDEGGCPTEPEQIGLTLDQVRDSYQAARRIRRRYTVLDLAYETGVLDDMVADAFAHGGYWAKQSAVIS